MESMSHSLLVSRHSKENTLIKFYYLPNGVTEVSVGNQVYYLPYTKPNDRDRLQRGIIAMLEDAYDE
jgi:hypothetical protein